MAEKRKCCFRRGSKKYSCSTNWHSFLFSLVRIEIWFQFYSCSRREDVIQFENVCFVGDGLSKFAGIVLIVIHIFGDKTIRSLFFWGRKCKTIFCLILSNCVSGIENWNWIWRILWWIKAESVSKCSISVLFIYLDITSIWVAVLFFIIVFKVVYMCMDNEPAV